MPDVAWPLDIAILCRHLGTRQESAHMQVIWDTSAPRQVDEFSKKRIQQ